jgi:hypothetical protein
VCAGAARVGTRCRGPGATRQGGTLPRAGAARRGREPLRREGQGRVPRGRGRAPGGWGHAARGPGPRHRGRRRGAGATSPGRGRGHTVGGWGRAAREGRGRARGGQGRAAGEGLGSRRGVQGRAGWGARGAQGRRKGRERGKGELTLGIQNPAIIVTGSPRARGGGERERWKRGRGNCCTGKTNERKGERGHGGREGHQGRTGPGWARSGRVGLGRGPGPKPTTHTTTNRKPITNRNPKRGETDARLNTTSDKREMLRHDATLMST